MEKTFFIIYSDVKVRKMFLFTFFFRNMINLTQLLKNVVLLNQLEKK